MQIGYGSYAELRPSLLAGTSPSTRAECADTTYPYISLHISGTKLKDMDVLSLSDPMCVLFVNSGDGWKEFGRTEVIQNNLNPEWVTHFTVMYIFEIRQPLLFKVYDVDHGKADCDLSKQDFIGEAEVELSQIVNERGTVKLPLHVKGKDEVRGVLNVAYEQVENCASIVNGQIQGVNLKRMQVLGRNEPFFVLSKASETGSFLPVFRSEVDRKMRWKPFSVPYQVLCNIDPDRPLRVIAYHRRKRREPKEIGYHDTTFSRLSESVDQLLPLTDEHNKNVGSFKVLSISLQQRYNFCDYLRSGIRLNLITAIDFTGSNKDPDMVDSLHYLSPNGDSLNQYEKCITAVGNILCPYDSDQLFAVYGFGAKVHGQIQHCFPLTFDPSSPCVHGLQGILDVYHHALNEILFSGPTLFSHVIRNASRAATLSFQESRTYTILLILTDGVINDMDDTKDAIVEAGRIPLSIIIVGVGNENFSAMEVLDADDEPLVSRSGRKMERDLVQFVPFEKFANKHPSLLAAEVLAEIPRQVVEWAEMNGVSPYVC